MEFEFAVLCFKKKKIVVQTLNFIWIYSPHKMTIFHVTLKVLKTSIYPFAVKKTNQNSSIASTYQHLLLMKIRLNWCFQNLGGILKIVVWGKREIKNLSYII